MLVTLHVPWQLELAALTCTVALEMDASAVRF
jgi:hypothetical protein